MDVAVLIVRCALAAIFALAAVTKLADLRGSREAVAGFGVPARLAGVAGVVLPLAELTVAVLLLPAATATAGLAGACALLLAFSVAIAVSMARGQAPDCHCFGQLHSEPAGWRTLVRNGGLLVAAAAALAFSLAEAGPSAVAWIGDLGAFAAVLVVAGAAFALAAAVVSIVRVARRPGHTHLREGDLAPGFVLPSLEGPEVSLDELLRRGPPVVLVFTDSDCADCKALLPELGPIQREADHAVTVAVVNAGDPAAVEGIATEHGLLDVLFDESREVQRAYAVHGSPSAIRLEGAGEATTLLVGGLDLTRALVQGLATGRSEPLGLPIGQPLPAAAVVVDDAGRRRPLVDLVQRETLFLFWDHDCGSCREIRDALLARQAELPDGAAELVIVTSGDAKAVSGEGFRAPVVVDPDRKAAEAVGAIGTPMAMLVDAEGRIGWPLAIGRSHILRLIRSRPRTAAAAPPRRESPATLTRE